MATASVGAAPQTVWEGLREDWLVVSDAAVDGCEFAALVNYRRQRLEAITIRSDKGQSARPLLLLTETDPTKFLAGFWAAVLEDWNIALANPNWGQQEWQSVHQLIHPQAVWGTAPPFPHSSSQLPSPPKQTSPAVLVPTGGTAGHIKFAQHTWHSLSAAVSGFCQQFAPEGGPFNACCVLPLYHVSGLMQALRTALSGGQLFIFSFKQLRHSLPTIDFSAAPAFISLVPTQLQRFCQDRQANWLGQFKAVLVGGAPCWPDLLSRATRAEIPVCLSYGMTETAAMVTARTVGDAQGEHSGMAMPHAAIYIERSGQRLPVGEIGQIVICSAAIAEGYYNAPSAAFALPGNFYTDDLGYLDAAGCLHITGRASGKIISGGENVFPAEVEAAIRQTGLVSDVCVFGMPHPEWGEAIAAAYVPVSADVSAEQLQSALSAPVGKVDADNVIAQLSRYKHPKQWFAVDDLPRNAQGKLNRKALRQSLTAG
ncbi:MAG: AMP-binding protein [Cyanobacteria bacterium J06634_6]